MLDNYKIRTKLLGGFLVVAALVALVGVIGLTSMTKLQTQTSRVAEVLMPSQRAVGLTNLGLADARRLELAMLQSKERKDEKAFSGNETDFDLSITNELEKGIKAYEAFPRSTEEDALYKKFSSALSDYRAHLKSVKGLLDADKVAEATPVVAEGKKLFTAATEQADAIATLEDTYAAAAAKSALDTSSSGRWTIIVALLIAIAFAVVVGVLLANNITAPLAMVVERAERLRSVCVAELNQGITAMSHGDLSVVPKPSTPFLKLARTDEIGVLAGTVDGMIAKTVDTIGSFVASQEAVRGLINEASSLNQKAVSGDMQSRGQVEKFEGAFAEIVKGVNQILDAVVTPVNEAADVLEAVAQRDLTARVVGNYSGDHGKIKASINTAVANLEEAISGIAVSTDQVAGAAGSIATGSQSLASGTSEQAASIEEISSSLQEIEAMVQQSAQSAVSAKSLAEGAQSAVEKGDEGVRELTDAMGKIKQSSDATTKIVKTIDEIAFQTNLLALNAAVEAARAGDAGRGFAVVAEEVRSLALRAAEAAKSTAVLIEEGANNAMAGVGASNRVSAALADISERTTKVSTVMNEIVAASDQQKAGIVQVNVAVSQMSAGTQSAAANAEESASAAEELSGQAQTMQTVVRAFVVGNAQRQSTPSYASDAGRTLKTPPSAKRGAKRSIPFAEF